LISVTSSKAQVNFTRAEEKFRIQLIMFSEPDMLKEINIESLLKENKCIPFE